MAIRVAWHASGTYDAAAETGGSDGATMRFEPERSDGANAGLFIIHDLLLQVKSALGSALSLADLQAYATEAARLDGLKKSCLGKLLAEARGRLVPLWAELHIPDDQARKRPAAWATHGIGEGADSSSNSA